MDKEALLAPRIAVRTEEVPVEGGTVTVRGLSRMELILAQKLEHDRPKQEQFLLSVAMVEPELTEGEVKAWQKQIGTCGEIETVARKINELSGLGKDAAKSDLPGDGED